MIRKTTPLSSCWILTGAYTGLQVAIASFTLHDPKGRRLIGFDNAHHPSQRAGAAIAKPAAKDHWHRTRSEAGVPYAFRDAETLLADFFREVGRVLAEAGVSDDVVRVEER